jgi:thioesterase domain-containing protein
LFASPTVWHVARTIENDTQPTAFGQCCNRGEEGSKCPLYVIGWYLDINFGGDNSRDCYVLPFPDFEHSPVQCRIEALAERFLDDLRAVQPRGPYLLAGYSLAGLIAYEMACRLEAEGEKVSIVALVDAYPAGWAWRIAPAVVGFLARLLPITFSTQLTMARSWFYLIEQGQHARRHGLRATLRALRLHGTRAWRRWSAKRKSAEVRVAASETRPKLPQRCIREEDLPFGRFWPHRWAYSAYRPKKYAGLVALFTCEESAAHDPRPFRGWGRWVSQVREYMLPGTHGSCISQSKAELAEAFRECLEDVDDGYRCDHSVRRGRDVSG